MWMGSFRSSVKNLRRTGCNETEICFSRHPCQCDGVHKFISYMVLVAPSNIMLGNFLGNYVQIFRKSFANIRPDPGCHGGGGAAAGILWALYPRSILEFSLVYLHDLLPGATINWRFSRNKDLIPFKKLTYAQVNPIAPDAFFSISTRTFTESCGNTGDYRPFFVSREMTEHRRPPFRGFASSHKNC